MLHHLRPDTPLLFYSERQQQYYLLSDDAVCGPTLKRVDMGTPDRHGEAEELMK